MFDRERAEAAVRELLIAVGEDPDREGLQDTPARVARAYEEVFAGLHVDPTEVLNKTFSEDHQELVLVKDIPIYSTCEHHLVPFFGHAHIGYIPGKNGQVTGLSKLARLVDLFAKRPQVQERLTTQVAETGRTVSHRRHRVRAPVHGHARDPQTGCPNHHIRCSRWVQSQRRITRRSALPHPRLNKAPTRP